MLAATNRTIGESTFAATAAASFRVSSHPPINYRASGVIDLPSHSSDFTVSVSGTTGEVRTIGGVEYSSTNGGVTWQSVPDAGASQPLNTGPLGDVPFNGFRFLQHVKSVQVDGSGVVDGYKVTLYSFGFNLEPGEPGLTNVPGTVAIDDNGLIRQFSYTISTSSDGVTSNEPITLTFSNFGSPVNIVAPPAAEVVPESQDQSGFGFSSSSS